MWSRSLSKCLVLAACCMLAGALQGDAVGAAASATAPEYRFTTRFTYYDEAPLDGLVKMRTDAAGRVMRYDYTSRGQLGKVTFSDGRTVEYVYDKLGRRVAMKDAAGTTRYRYDNLNRLVRVDQANGLWVEFEYDWQGRVTAMVMPAGAAEGGKALSRSARGTCQAEGEEAWRVEYAYDLAGRIARIDSPVGRFSWTYDAAEGTVTRRMPNGVVSTFFHLPDGLLERIRHEREAAGDGGNAAGRELLVEFSYAYHPGGRAASETVTTSTGSETTHYEYDRLGRLTAARLPGDGTLADEYLCSCQLGTAEIFRKSQFPAACRRSVPRFAVGRGHSGLLDLRMSTGLGPGGFHRQDRLLPASLNTPAMPPKTHVSGGLESPSHARA